MKSPAILILSFALLATACAENDDGPDPNYGVWGYELDEELGCVSRRGEPTLYLGATQRPSEERGTSQTCLINLNDGRIVFPDRFVEVDTSDGTIPTAHDGLENWRTCSSVGQIRPPFCESLEAEEPVEEEPVEEDPTDPQ